MGGRRGYGPTHSQTLEKHFLGVPGLRVLAPAPWETLANCWNRRSCWMMTRCYLSRINCCICSPLPPAWLAEFDLQEDYPTAQNASAAALDPLSYARGVHLASQRRAAAPTEHCGLRVHGMPGAAGSAAPGVRKRNFCRAGHPHTALSLRNPTHIGICRTQRAIIEHRRRRSEPWDGAPKSWRRSAKAGSAPAKLRQIGCARPAHRSHAPLEAQTLPGIQEIIRRVQLMV